MRKFRSVEISSCRQDSSKLGFITVEYLETVAGEKQLREMTEAIDLKLRVRERLDAEVSALKTNNVSLKQGTEATARCLP